MSFLVEGCICKHLDALLYRRLCSSLMCLWLLHINCSLKALQYTLLSWFPKLSRIWGVSFWMIPSFFSPVPCLAFRGTSHRADDVYAIFFWMWSDPPSRKCFWICLDSSYVHRYLPCDFYIPRSQWPLGIPERKLRLICVLHPSLPEAVLAV